jgi:hypothetical protein
MTRYTVVWHRLAEDQLLECWLAAADRQSIADAADAIDRELTHDAGSKGAIVEDNIREASHPYSEFSRFFCTGPPHRL